MVEDDCLNYTCPYVIDNALPNDVYQLKTMAGKKLKQKQNGRNLKKFLECQKNEADKSDCDEVETQNGKQQD